MLIRVMAVCDGLLIFNKPEKPWLKLTDIPNPGDKLKSIMYDTKLETNTKLEAKIHRRQNT